MGCELALASVAGAARTTWRFTTLRLPLHDRAKTGSSGSDDGRKPHTGEHCNSYPRTHSEDEPCGRIRAHDAWALELPVLLDTMNAKAVEIDLGQHGMQAALAVLSGQICVLVRPGLSEQQLPVAIRSLLA